MIKAKQNLQRGDAIDREEFYKTAIKRTQEELVASLKQYQQNYFGKKASDINYTDIRNLPLAYFAYFLADPMIYYGVPDPFPLMDPNKHGIDDIRTFMEPILHKLDDDPRINGRFTKMSIEDVEFFRELLELISMYQTHPSRSQVLCLEVNTEFQGFSQRSPLRNEIVNGRLLSLLLAIDVFLEYSEKQAASKSCRKMPKSR